MDKDGIVLQKNAALTMSPVNDGALIAVNGELKKIECDYPVLTEVLEKAEEPKSYDEIVEKLTGKYEREEVEIFLNVLIEEGLFDVCEKNGTEVIQVRMIGEGKLTEKIKNALPKDIRAEITMSAEEYLYEKDKKYAGITVIVSENYDIETILNLNQKLLREESMFTLVTFINDKVRLGPSVIPWKSACVGCFYTHQVEQLKAISDSEICFEDVMKLQHSCVGREAEECCTKYISDIAQEIRILSSGNGTPLFINRLFEYEAYTSSAPKVISFTPTTACPACSGMNKKYISYKDYTRKSRNRTSILLSGEKILYRTGGFRSVSAEETEKILSDTIERIGIDVTVEESYENPLSDVLPSFDASIKTSYKNKTPFILQAINSQGKGLNPKQAYFSACFELFERLSARYYGDKKIIRATPAEVGERGFDLDRIEIQKRILDKDFCIERSREIDWVEATSVITGNTKFVPASLVYLSNVSFRRIGNEISSTGLAAGAALEDAILQGLFEVIEHDAWIMGQANRVTLPRVDVYSSKNEKLKTLVRKIETLGYEVITRDYTNDLGFPVFRTWIVNRNDFEHYAVNGFGASLSAEIALERSVTEAVQSLIPEKDIDICDYGTVSEFESMYSYDSFYSLSYFVQKDINAGGEKIKKMDEYAELDFLSVKEMIDSVSDRIRSVLGEKSDILFVDLTKDFIGIPVVRVIIEGDIQRTGDPVRAVSRRTLSYPVYMGYGDKEASVEELYLGPYPH